MVGLQLPLKRLDGRAMSKDVGQPDNGRIDLDRLTALVPCLDYAFQPVVNIATGHCFGYEALLRHHDACGYATPRDFFDACAAGGMLDVAQMQLWEKAVAKFAGLSGGRGARLFLNIDSRSFDGTDLLTHHIKGLLAHYDLPESAVAFELTEQPPVISDDPRQWIKPFKATSCKLALDRFGGMASGSALLYASEPDFIKIDPFFVLGVSHDSRKKLLLSQMVGVAHLLGIMVIAVGVETEKDFLTCKEIGCDLVQGFLISRPVLDVETLPSNYAAIEELSRNDRRHKRSDQKIILDQMEHIEALPVDAEITAVFDCLRHDTQRTFVPIVDHMGQPLGIVRESNIKNYAYSPFGKDLISNKGLGRKLKDFIVRCPVADLHQPVENIISIYSGEDEADGIMLVDQMRYVGFLSARSIIRVINEKSLAMARDQNPLTKLPGNALINQYVTESLSDSDIAYVYAYVDFDNFKPFNDKYGFRQGDRAILLFAELMRKKVAPEHFLGHIGGDDFFVGFKGLSNAEAEAELRSLLEDFRSDAESFYDAEARDKGCITSIDRDGNPKVFPLLTASAALVEVKTGRAGFNVDDVSALIAKLKKLSKASPTKLASGTLGG